MDDHGDAMSRCLQDDWKISTPLPVPEVAAAFRSVSKPTISRKKNQRQQSHQHHISDPIITLRDFTARPLFPLQY